METWFDATDHEQAALMGLVKEVKRILDASLNPKPDGYNVGFNAGGAAGQTVPHVHIHVIPRYFGDMDDPRGGVRHVIPRKGNYLAERKPANNLPTDQAKLHLSTGHPHDPLWNRIATRIPGASSIDILASFVQPSGLDLIQSTLFAALRTGSHIRILVGDYLFITAPEALERLLGWIELAKDEYPDAKLEVRLAEMEKLLSRPASFHPKAWRIVDRSGGLFVVGSSNISQAALESGIEWNLIGQAQHDDEVVRTLAGAFNSIWEQATALDAQVIQRYAAAAARARKLVVEPESIDTPLEPKSPRPWQRKALEALAEIRKKGYRRALVAVATGLGKTWLAAFDVIAVGSELKRRPRVMLIAHRAEILIQAEKTFRTAINAHWKDTKISRYLGSLKDLSGDLVIASVQKLSRFEGLTELELQNFDYVVVDEVHHAEAPSYRRVFARLHSTFILGLTATPERTDGVDVATLFDDVLAWQSTVGDGIAEGSLVPFHYIGLKDDVDFQQIPWRNGRFDPAELEQKLENSKRMERLWTTWQLELVPRTIVFCCSRRHALFVRNWLLRRGVKVAAIFSGEGGDPRGKSLEEFAAGQLDAICVVDLFNEGIDIPEVNRVVMLRPTESKVIFLQQLGRGLRAAEGKSHLRVIDFVGNHRIFASRLMHILSLGGKECSWSDLKAWVDGKNYELPDGCLVDVDLEARDILRQLVPKGGSAVIDGYRSLRDELQRRPTMSELFHRGYLPSTIRARYGGWFGLVNEEGDLSSQEQQVLGLFNDWLAMLEATSLNKSYKMVVLRVLLDHGAFWAGMSIESLAKTCREFLLAHPILRADLPPTKEIPNHILAPISKWAAWWLEWPLSRWMDNQSGHKWFKREGDKFQVNFECTRELRPEFEAMTSELVDYRISQYVHSRLGASESNPSNEFIAKVSHSGGRPILMLPTTEEVPGRPVGPIEVLLPDNSVWVFRLVKIACNVANPKGTEVNQLGILLRRWFEADAGMPGTGFKVVFQKSDQGWAAKPVQPSDAKADFTPVVMPDLPKAENIIQLVSSPDASLRFTRFVPVFSLEAAAGQWGPELEPEEIGWVDASRYLLKSGMFVVKVRGRSMEPKIPDGSWCLFRKCPPGSREGKIVLVQFNSLGDLETGGRYTVKKYHSVKIVTEDSWAHQRVQLLPLNPEYQPIEVDPAEAEEMIVVGEFIGVL